MEKANLAALMDAENSLRPEASAPAPSATPAQQAFRRAVLDVQHLRERLRALRAQQAEARRRYWQQVGPAAAAVVQARRALYEPLEGALVLGYFSRLEEARIVELLVANAQTLEERFGEDEAAVLTKYAPVQRPAAAEEPAATPAANNPAPVAPAAAHADDRPPHERADARPRRPGKAQRAAEAAARADQRLLETDAKTLYRQLARAHHPDLERDPAKQAARTAQMQRITEAYEADDLYALLELLAATDGPADAAAEATLARYARALGQQRASLEKEWEALRQADELGSTATTPKKRELELRQLKRDLRAEAEYVQELGRQMATPAGLRELLRELAAAGQTEI